jgi:integrase/ribosomal protein L40E
MDIHNQEIILKQENALLRKSSIPEENKRLIEKFQRELVIEGIKTPKLVRYSKTLRTVCERWKNKPFSKWTVEDVKDVLYSIETDGYEVKEKVNGKIVRVKRKYKTHSINEFKKGLRKFFRWYKGETWEGLKPLRGEKKEDRKPDVLSEDEILKMIEARDHPRDKAIIAVGYEAGLRIGELANLQIKHITWNTNGAKIKVHGKTGERVIPIVMAAPYLRRWVDHHPFKDDPEAFVFIGLGTKNHGKPMVYQAFRKVIRQAATKAKIKKKVYPHILRHSRATILANFLTEAQMNIFFGWVQGSDMPAIYVHLSGRDIDNAINKVYGIETEEEKKETKLKPQKCPRCEEMNSPTAKFCQRCGLVLDEKERLKVQFEESKTMPEIMGEILIDPERRNQFKEMLQFVEAMESNPEISRKFFDVFQQYFGKEKV